MSNQKIWSDFNRLKCGKTEKNIRRNMVFQQARGNLLFSERMVLHGESKLEKNETNHADIYNS